MGIVCAPSYNNLFMAQFGEKHIYPYIIDMPRFYLRYIDDVFFLNWDSLYAILNSHYES